MEQFWRQMVDVLPGKRMFKKLTNRLKRFLAWLGKVRVRWGSLPPADVVIFDITNIDYLKPLCGQFRVMSLDVSGREIHLSLALLLDVMGLALRGVPPRAAYYAALICRAGPAIVVTYIDNANLFYRVASVCHPRMRFLAIQNAARYDILELSPRAARKIFIPEFACFGEYERDLYLGRGGQVGRFYPIGSLREACYRRFRAISGQHNSQGRYDYDLCVVAEASPGWDRKYPGFEDAIGRIAQYAVRLSRERGLNLVIAGKRDVSPCQERATILSRDAEILWYEKYIGTEVPITPRIRVQFTTYGLVSRSRLSLAMVSTALREGVSRGDRVLFCNFSGNPLWDFPVDGIWSLKEDSYEAFAERVMAMLALSDENYDTISQEMARYIINNAANQPTDEVLSKLIFDAVAAKA